MTHPLMSKPNPTPPLNPNLHQVMKDEVPLQNPSEFSSEFQDFVTLCLKKDPAKRPTAQQLLCHPFIRKVSGPASGCVRVARCCTHALHAKSIMRTRRATRIKHEPCQSSGVVPWLCVLGSIAVLYRGCAVVLPGAYRQTNFIASPAVRGRPSQRA